MKRYLMHECSDDRHLPPLEVVLASEHDIVVNGLRSLVTALRQGLANTDADREFLRKCYSEIKHERDKLLSRPKKTVEGGPLPIGMRRTRAVIVAHVGGKYTVRCGCGTSFERGRSALLRADFWRCMTCYRSQVSR